MKIRAVMLQHKLEALCMKVRDACPPLPLPRTRMLEVLYHISKQIIGVKDGAG